MRTWKSASDNQTPHRDRPLTSVHGAHLSGSEGCKARRRHEGRVPLRPPKKDRRLHGESRRVSPSEQPSSPSQLARLVRRLYAIRLRYSPARLADNTCQGGSSQLRQTGDDRPSHERDRSPGGLLGQPFGVLTKTECPRHRCQWWRQHKGSIVTPPGSEHPTSDESRTQRYRFPLLDQCCVLPRMADLCARF